MTQTIQANVTPKVHPKAAQLITTQLRTKGQRCTTLLFDTTRGDTLDQLNKSWNNKAILAIAETSNHTFVGYTKKYFYGQWQQDPDAWVAWSGSSAIFSGAAGEVTFISSPSHGILRWGAQYYQVLTLGVSSGSGSGGQNAWQGATTAAHNAQEGQSYAGCNFPSGPLVPTRVVIFEVSTTAGPCAFVKQFASGVVPHVISQLQVYLRSHKAFTEDEEEQFAAMAGRPIPALVSTEFVLTDASSTQSAVLLEGLRTANTLVVSSPIALSNLCGLPDADGSQVVRIRLEFAITADSPQLIAALTHCGPFVHVLEAPCTSVDHARSIVQVMRRCPPQHLKCVYLTGTKTLDTTAMEVFAELKDCTVLKLVFDENPTGIPMSLTKLLHYQNPKMDVDSHVQLESIPYPPDAGLRIVAPVAVGALYAGQLGFPVLTPLIELKYVPCSTAAAMKVSTLLRDMLQEPHDEPHAPQFRTRGEGVDSIRVVQLVAAYIEYAARLVPDALDDTVETVYRITLYDECFLKELEAGAAPREVLHLVLDLLGAATFLNMPSLKRLLRSYLIRSASAESGHIAKLFSGCPR